MSTGLFDDMPDKPLGPSPSSSSTGLFDDMPDPKAKAVGVTPTSSGKAAEAPPAEDPDAGFGGAVRAILSHPEAAALGPAALAALAAHGFASKAGPLDAVARGGVQGATLGTADEAQAAARAAIRKAKGDNGAFGDLYNEEVENARSGDKAAQAAHPYLYAGGEAAGALALPVTDAAAVPSLAARVGIRAAEGAGYGAASGFGTSEGGPENRIAGAGAGGVTGGFLGSIAEPIVTAGEHLVQPLVNSVRAVTHPAAEAARRFTEAADQGEQANLRARALNTPRQNEIEQVAADIGPDSPNPRAGGALRNMDVNGAPVRNLVRASTNIDGGAQEIIDASNRQVFGGQAERITNFLRGMAPQGGDAATTRFALDQAARRQRGPLYRAAYAEGDRPLVSPELEQLTGSPDVQDALREAIRTGKGQAIADGYGAFNPGVQITDDGRIIPIGGKKGVPAFPNLQLWDYTKRVLDGKASSAFRQGDNTAGQRIAAQAKMLRDELDRHVPIYAQARGTAQDFFRANSALEAGENFARGGFANSDAARHVARMNQADLDAFREGYLSSLINKVNSPGADTRNVVPRLASSDTERQRNAIALGQGRANEIEALQHLETITDLGRRAMGNSTTARQLLTAGVAGGAGMAYTGDWREGLLSGIAFGLVHHGLNRATANRYSQMHEAIARMAVSNDERTFRRVAQNAAHSRLLGQLRDFVTDPALAGFIGGNAVAQGRGQ